MDVKGLGSSRCIFPKCNVGAQIRHGDRLACKATWVGARIHPRRLFFLFVPPRILHVTCTWIYLLDFMRLPLTAPLAFSCVFETGPRYCHGSLFSSKSGGEFMESMHKEKKEKEVTFQSCRTTMTLASILQPTASSGHTDFRLRDNGSPLAAAQRMHCSGSETHHALVEDTRGKLSLDK